ncbi:MAG: competence/damage-inducible protein A [Gemmatimonadales bacterium]|jgi:nicotinamide-nucleotide amidase
MDCELLTVGTELLLGYTVDTNAAQAGRLLADAGVRVTRRATVGDDAEAVRDAAAAALERTGTVIVTGGLGPTADDLTREAVAALFGRRLIRDPAILQALEARFAKLGRGPMPESNARQADVPEGATVLPNRWGTAPGLWLEGEGARLAVLLPGVPVEMRGLLEAEVIPRLIERRTHGRTDAQTHGAADAGAGPEIIRSRTLRTTGISESALADRVGDPARLVGPNVTVAWLPSPEGTDLRLTAWGLPAAAADAALARAVAAVRPLAGAHCYGEGDADLAALMLTELERRQCRLAVAESCTGGLIGERLTAVPGSSRVFVGGVVAYANEVKLDLLGVSADALAAHGAVSEPVAREMASGIARTLGTEAAVAVTGIAGPDGGTEEKPVGTVWIAALWQGKVRAFHYVFPGERDVVRRRAAQAALDALRCVLAGEG